MSKGSSSCLKSLVGCCLGVIILILVLGAIVVFMFKSNRMEKPVFAEVDKAEHFDSHELQGVVLSNLPPDVVPVRVRIKVENCNLNIVPDGPSGTIKVSGEYDTANGNFHFVRNQSSTGQSFDISYKARNNFFFNIGNDHLDKAMDRNQLTVHLPLDSALDLEIQHEKGELEVDLSGIPIYMLNVNCKISTSRIRNLVKNPLVMKEMNLKQSMGEMDVKDLQNYRFEKMGLDFSMGDYRLRSSDLFPRSALIEMDLSIGNFAFVFPENARIINELDSGADSVYLTLKENPDKNVDITLKGRVKWGEARISQ